jgi:hypothetical protein
VPARLYAVRVTLYTPAVGYVTICVLEVDPVGEAVAPKSQSHPVGLNAGGFQTELSTKYTVPPVAIEIEVAPVAVEKFTIGGDGIGPLTVDTGAGVESKLG